MPSPFYKNNKTYTFCNLAKFFIQKQDNAKKKGFLVKQRLFYNPFFKKIFSE